jgi:hypothetical protein
MRRARVEKAIARVPGVTRFTAATGWHVVEAEAATTCAKK